MTDYEIKYYSSAGAYLGSFLAFGRLEYARKENEVGALTLELPDFYPDSFWRVDNRLEVWRRVPGQPAYLDGETVWLLRAWRYKRLGRSGIVRLSALDGVNLLTRRVVAYAAGAEEAAKEGPADDLIKMIARENMGASATDTARNLSAYLTVAGDAAAAPSVKKEFSRRTVLDVCRELADAAKEKGTYLAFDVTGGYSGGAFTLSTYIGQRGADHSQGSANPLTISEALGSLADPELSYDYLDEVNYVYAGGQGEGELRVVAEVADAARMAASPFNRCEGFADARNTEDPDALTDEANAALENGRPRLTLTGKMMNVPTALYGVHYRFGDLVTASHRGIVMNGHVDTVHVTIDKGNETLDVSFAGEAGL